MRTDAQTRLCVCVCESLSECVRERERERGVVCVVCERESLSECVRVCVSRVWCGWVCACGGCVGVRESECVWCVCVCVVCVCV